MDMVYYILLLKIWQNPSHKLSVGKSINNSQNLRFIFKQKYFHFKIFIKRTKKLKNIVNIFFSPKLTKMRDRYTYLLIWPHIYNENTKNKTLFYFIGSKMSNDWLKIFFV